MKRFLIKFCILFLMIDGYLAIYHYIISPRFVGDIGKMGQIMFDVDYQNSIKNSYPMHKLYVKSIQNIDCLSQSPNDTIRALFTIGDSFSQQNLYGYAQFLGEELCRDIYNISRCPLDISPLQHLVKLLNRNEIPKQSIVIIESVERYMITGLRQLNFNDTIEEIFIDKDIERGTLLKNSLQFISKSIGYKQCVHRFDITTDLFSHKNRVSLLYVYDSPWDNDGDFRFVEFNMDDYKTAYNNLYTLHEMAEAHDIHMLFLIAADKYDVYAPFIIDNNFPRNPTLDSLLQEQWIINTKPILQIKAFEGVKDLYYINDTHWSPIGAKIVGEEIAQRIMDIGLLYW